MDPYTYTVVKAMFDVAFGLGVEIKGQKVLKAGGSGSRLFEQRRLRKG